MYRGSGGSTGGRGGEDSWAVCAWDGKESYGGLAWIIYRWLMARPLSFRYWHLERTRLSALSTVWCRAGVNEIVYRCRPSRMNLGELSAAIKQGLLLNLFVAKRGLKKQQQIYTWSEMSQQRSKTSISANPTENDALDAKWYISECIGNKWPMHQCCLGLFEI